MRRNHIWNTNGISYCSTWCTLKTKHSVVNCLTYYKERVANINITSHKKFNPMIRSTKVSQILPTLNRDFRKIVQSWQQAPIQRSGGFGQFRVNQFRVLNSENTNKQSY